MTHCRLEGCHGEVFDHDHSVLCVGQCWGQLLRLWSTVSHHSHGIIHQILGVETEYLAMDHETGSKTAPSPPLCCHWPCPVGATPVPLEKRAETSPNLDSPSLLDHSAKAGPSPGFKLLCLLRRQKI